VKYEVPLAPSLDLSDAAPEEQQRVEGIVAEADAEGYWFHASRDGSREAHYRWARGALAALRGFGALPASAAAPPPARHQRPQAWAAAGTNHQRRAARPCSCRSTALGVTLVHELSCFQPGEAGAGEPGWTSALPDVVRRFRARVEEELPGLYSWFGEDSLHITIRALMG
jgi:hypothetical protein